MGVLVGVLLRGCIGVDTGVSVRVEAGPTFSDLQLNRIIGKAFPPGT